MTQPAQQTTAENTPQRTRGGQYGRRPGTDEREAVVAMLRNQGLETAEIAKTLGIATASVYNIEHRIKKNGKIPLLSPKRIKKATKAIDAFIEGQSVGDVKPKCSTVLAAANVVLDRAYPKAQEEGGKGNISFTQVNISLAGPASDPPIISNATLDITPISE